MRNAVDNRIKKGLNADFIEEDSEIIEKTRTELDEYFKENRIEFDVPIQMVGTDFQKSVWKALLKSCLWHYLNLPSTGKRHKQ